MGIYFEVSKRRYIKNNKKVLEVQIFAQPFWDNRDIKWSNNKRFQKGCGEFHERIFRYRWLHGAGRWCVQIICRWIVLLWIHEWLRDIWIILESCIKILFSDANFSRIFNKRKPTTDHWMDFSIGSSACHIAVSQIQKRKAVDVELYINDDKELFKSLFAHKDEIETSYEKSSIN